MIKNYMELWDIIQTELENINEKVDFKIELNKNCVYPLENGVNILLDDLRVFNNHFHLCARNYFSMTNLLDILVKHNIPINIISFDHDLGKESMFDSGLDGYGIAKYITEKDIHFKQAKFHTDNFTGFQNMQGILKSWQKHVPEAPRVLIDTHPTESLNYLK